MSNKRSFTIGQPIALRDGTQWRVVSYGAGAFRLRDEDTGEYLAVDHIELTRLLPPGERLQKSKSYPVDLTVADIETMLDDKAKDLIPHLQELIDGTPAVGDEPRPNYALDLPMSWRLASKSKEIGIPAPTLKTKLARFRKDGPAALVDGRAKRKEKALARLHPDVADALVHVLADFEGKSDRKMTAVRAAVKRRLIEQFPDPDTRPEVASISTITRHVHKLGKRTGTARQWEQKTQRSSDRYRPRRALAPGEECQIDTTPLDLFVRKPGGKPFRPELTILTDKYTKSILGFNLTEGKPTGTDHATLLARAVVPRPLRPWARKYSELHLPTMPWAKHLTDEQRERYDVHRPLIYPNRIVVDNDRAFTGRVFSAAKARAGITVTEAPPQSPTTKSGVERTFASIESLFSQHLPGYCGSSSESRGRGTAPEEEDGLLDLRTVAELFDIWVAVIWQNRQHAGLVDPWDPTTEHSPNTMYAASLDITGHFTVGLEPVDFISMMAMTPRTVQADGIVRDGRTYDSVHLAALRGLRDENSQPLKVDVYYDPLDPFQVWVRHPFDDEWITCEWSKADTLDLPHASEISQRALALSQQNPGFTNEEADDKLIEFYHQAAVELAASEATQLQELKKRVRSAKRGKPIADALAPADIEIDPTQIPRLGVA